MGRRFKIERNYYDDNDFIYKKQHVIFEPGLTVLVGCNGAGKTTLLSQIKRIVQHDLHLPCVYFNNLSDGGSNSINKAIFTGDIRFVNSVFSSSEGEALTLNLGMAAQKIGAMFAHNPDADEYWILLDSIDSGLSIDGIEDLKHGLFDLILKRYSDKTVYIIVSANEYEMACGEKCFDVVNCKYVNIKSYNRYKSIIIRSRVYKDERYAENQGEAESEDN